MKGEIILLIVSTRWLGYRRITVGRVVVPTSLPECRNDYHRCGLSASSRVRWTDENCELRYVLIHQEDIRFQLRYMMHGLPSNGSSGTLRPLELTDSECQSVDCQQVAIWQPCSHTLSETTPACNHSSCNCS